MSLRKNDRPEDEVPSSDSKSYMDRKLSWNARLELARQSREQVLNKCEGQSVLPDRKPWETYRVHYEEPASLEAQCGINVRSEAKQDKTHTRTKHQQHYL